MEFRDGGDAASSSHFPAAEAAFPNRTGHFPLPQDDKDDEEIQRRVGDTQNRGRNIPPDGEAFFVIMLSLTALLMFFIFEMEVSEVEVFILTPRASVLIEPPLPLFVEYLTVGRIDGAASKLMLYGFDGTPPLNVVNSWSENHQVNLPGEDQKEWFYFLNNGSEIDISYNVTTLTPHNLFLVIGEGPSSPKALFGGPINGTGEIRQDITKSARYYVGLYNMRFDNVEVDFQIRIRSLVYDTTNANYTCTINRGSCVMKIPYTGGIAILEYPDHQLGIDNNDESHVYRSYGPRWITNLGVIGVFLVVCIIVFRRLQMPPRTIESESSRRENIELQSSPLIPENDDDMASLGPSQNSDDPEDGPLVGLHKGNVASQI